MIPRWRIGKAILVRRKRKVPHSKNMVKDMMTKSVKFAMPPPPPPPPAPTAKSGRKMKSALIAATLIVIIVVAMVGLFVFNIIPWPFKSGGGGGGLVNYGVLMGKVTDTYGDPVSNVTVSVGGQSAMTNPQGWYTVSNLAPANKQLVTFSRNGSATTYQVTDIQTGKSSFVEATMRQVDQTSSIPATTGGTVKNQANNAYVTIGVNSLTTSQGTAYSGTATVMITSYDPSNELEANAFPGEYLGVLAQNQTVVPIKSFGFMDISVMTPSGDRLNLTSGKTASIAIPVPASMQTDAANLGTCPLWYFDTLTGTWKEEGSGTYDYTIGCFVGNVTHFSVWNYDLRYPAGFVSGRVVNSLGNPVQGAQVKCWGTGWYQQRWASGETQTGADGNFTRIPVEVGVVFKYQASKGGHKSIVSQAGPLAKNQEINVGDIVLDSPIVQTTLTWGADPTDLDSHLTARLTGNVTLHVYWSSKGSLSYDPWANLDTDVTTGFGPEVVSISRLSQGTYRYSVRHYAGDGTISTSGAEVNVVIPDTGIYRFTPPAGQPTNTTIWRVFDIVVDANGRLTLNTINDYKLGALGSAGDESADLYPP
jgi:protocatechuate 3,4-dioxygenase beta subunit